MNDIKWNYRNNDIEIVEDKDNIIQAIINRLNTGTDELDYLYDNYGCNLRQFLGLPSNNTTLELVKNAIIETLSYDKRLTITNLDLSYKNADTMVILLSCSFNDTEFELNLNLNNEGINIGD